MALDLPGHGASADAKDPQATYCLPGYAELVAAFVKKLDIDNAVIVGWSLGGHIALEVSKLLPDLAGMMIFGTPPAGKPIAADAFSPNPLMPLIFKNTLSSDEAVAVTNGFFKPGSQIPAFFSEDMTRTDGRAREALWLSVGEENYEDEVAIVATLNKPLAIIHGEKDPLVSLPYIKGLSIPTLWRDEIQIIPDVGHTPQWEQTEKFNNLLIAFITDCTGVKLLYKSASSG